MRNGLGTPLNSSSRCTDKKREIQVKKRLITLTHVNDEGEDAGKGRIRTYGG